MRVVNIYDFGSKPNRQIREDGMQRTRWIIQRPWTGNKYSVWSPWKPLEPPHSMPSAEHFERNGFEEPPANETGFECTAFKCEVFPT